MAGFSDYLIKKVLDRLFGGTAYASPSLYFALYTTLPNKAGAGGVEVIADGYERKLVANTTSEWPLAVGTTKKNANAITFATPGEIWGDIVGVGIFDSARADTQSFTTTHGTDTINLTAHGYNDGDTLLLTGTVLPTGYTALTPYYVRDKTTDAFKVALTPGGAAVAISDNGTGPLYASKIGNLLAFCPITSTYIPSGVNFTIPANALELTLTGMSDYLNRRTLDYLFGGSAFTVPATLYQALFTTAPDSAGAGGVEPSGNAYAREAVTNNATEFPDSTLASGAKTNANAQTFATPTPAGWGTVVAVGMYDASTGGNLWFSDAVSDTVVAVSDPYVIAAGDLRLNLY